MDLYLYIYSFDCSEVTQTTAFRLLLVISLLTLDVSIYVITQSNSLWKTTGDNIVAASPTLSFDDERHFEELALGVGRNINNEISESKSEVKNENVSNLSLSVSQGKRIERVIVLYSDHSFESYTSL